MELLRASDMEVFGDEDITEAELYADWRHPRLHLSQDVWLVEDSSGAAAGYAWILDRGGDTPFEGWGVVHPEHCARGIGSFLVDVREHRARELSEAAGDSRRLLFSHVAGPDRRAHALLQRRGYSLVRHSWRMDIDLTRDRPSIPPRDREPLAGVSIRSFRPGEDDRAVHAAREEAFADHWAWAPARFEEWATRAFGNPSFDPSLWRVATEGDEIAGILLGSVDEGTGWVESLGVRPHWRRRGIARALLLDALEEFRRRGLRRGSLHVDAQNETGATHLYERVGMTVAQRYDTFAVRLG